MSISRTVILNILWRSLFLQAAWNFKAMQNIGFTYAMIPGLKRIGPERLGEAIKRYLTFFNTQPYMAPTIAGVFLHLHERNDEEMITRISPSLCGSLAAIGDTFFWSTLKPILALTLLLFVFMDRFAGLFLALVFFNTAHLWVMAWGFLQGYRRGPQGALAVGQMLSVDLSRHISLVIPFLCGVLLCLAPRFSGVDAGLPVAVALFVAAIALIKLRVGIFWLVYGVFTLSMVWAMLQ